MCNEIFVSCECFIISSINSFIVAQDDGEVLNEDIGNEKILQNEKVQMESEKNIKGREFYDRLLVS